MACVRLGIHSAAGFATRPDMLEIMSPYGEPPCVAEAASAWRQASELHRANEYQATADHTS